MIYAYTMGHSRVHLGTLTAHGVRRTPCTQRTLTAISSQLAKLATDDEQQIIIQIYTHLFEQYLA